MTREDAWRRILHCRIADRTYCIDANRVATVMQGAAVTRHLNSSPVDDQSTIPGCVGQVDVDGQSVPVLRLRNTFDEAPSDDTCERREHLIVLTTQRGRLAILVDLVYRASHVEPGQLVALPELAKNPARPFFEGVVRVEASEPTQLEASFLGSILDDEPTDSDRRAPSVGRRAALLISPEGLLGESSSSKLPTPDLDIGALMGQSSRRAGQLMLFDLPHLTDSDKRTAVALSVTQVLEVTRAIELIRVPGAYDHLLGLATWRNQFVPVIDVVDQMGLGSSPTESRQRVVIARTVQNKLLGFYSSADIRTVRLPVESRPSNSPLGSLREAVIRGRFETQDALLVLPNLELLVG